MKKQYLRISIAAFFIAALTFSTSCSKKSSEDPKPATPPTTTPPPVASSKPAPPNTEKRATVPAEDGTGRPPLTDIPVGSVTVKDQESQRNSGMASENITKLDNLTGRGATSGRFSETTTTVFGWFVADVTINGDPLTDQEIFDKGLQQAIFFNIDSSGYTWTFENKSKTWSWGTYGIDKGMTTLALDFDENWVPTQLYTIAKITNNRLVLTGKVNMIEQFKGDTTRESVIFGLNGYDLSDNNYNGDMKTSPEEKVFLGNWNLQYYYDAEIDSTYSLTVAALCQIKNDGTWQFNVGGEVENGSWVIETIPELDSQQLPYNIFYLYTSSYDSSTSSIVIEKHLVYIQDDQMYMELQETSDPNDQDSIGDLYVFSK